MWNRRSGHCADALVARWRIVSLGAGAGARAPGQDEAGTKRGRRHFGVAPSFTVIRQAVYGLGFAVRVSEGCDCWAGAWLCPVDELEPDDDPEGDDVVGLPLRPLELPVDGPFCV